MTIEYVIRFHDENGNYRDRATGTVTFSDAMAMYLRCRAEVAEPLRDQIQLIEIQTQSRVRSVSLSRDAEASLWCEHTLGVERARNVKARADRMLEEALELYQSADGNIEDAAKLMRYVFSRPKGELAQEVGGLGITLLTFCNAAEIDFKDAVDAEQARVWTRVEEIRKKDRSRKDGPLPGEA